MSEPSFKILELEKYSFLIKTSTKKIVNHETSRQTRSSFLKKNNNTDYNFFIPKHKYNIVHVSSSEWQIINENIIIEECELVKNDDGKIIDIKKGGNNNGKYVKIRDSRSKVYFIIFVLKTVGFMEISNSPYYLSRINDISFLETLYPNTPAEDIEYSNNYRTTYYEYTLSIFPSVKVNIDKYYRKTIFDPKGNLKPLFQFPTNTTIEKYTRTWVVFISKIVHSMEIEMPENKDAYLNFLVNTIMKPENDEITFASFISMFIEKNNGITKEKYPIRIRQICDALLFNVRIFVVQIANSRSKAYVIDDVVREILVARNLNTEFYENLFKTHRAAKLAELNKQRISSVEINEDTVIINNKPLKFETLKNTYQNCYAMLRKMRKDLEDIWDIGMGEFEIEKFKQSSLLNKTNENSIIWFTTSPEVVVPQNNVEKLRIFIEKFQILLIISIFFCTPHPSRYANLLNTLFQNRSNLCWTDDKNILIRYFYNRKSKHKVITTFFLDKTISDCLIIFILKMKPLYILLVANEAKCAKQEFDIKFKNCLEDTRQYLEDNNEEDNNEEDNVDDDDEDGDTIIEGATRYGSLKVLSEFLFSYAYSYNNSYNVSLIPLSKFRNTVLALSGDTISYGIREYRQALPIFGIEVLNKANNSRIMSSTFEKDIQLGLQHTLETAYEYYSKRGDGISTETSYKKYKEVANVWRTELLSDNQLSQCGVQQQGIQQQDTTSSNSDVPKSVVVKQDFAILGYEELAELLRKVTRMELRSNQRFFFSLICYSKATAMVALCPTGFGKTHLIINYLKLLRHVNNEVKALIVVPYNTLKEELIKSYPDDIEDYNTGRKCRFIEAINFSSINKSFDENTKKYNIIMVDEFHTLQSGDFRNINIFNLNDFLLRKTSRIIFCSATSFNKDCYPYVVTHKDTDRSRKNFKLGKITEVNAYDQFFPKYKIIDKIYTDVSPLVSEIKCICASHRVAIVCKSLQEVEALSSMFDASISVSITSNERNSIAENCKVIIGTSIIATGLNIPNLRCIYTIGYYSIEDFIQTAGRLRNEGYVVIARLNDEQIGCMTCLVYEKYGKTFDKCHHVSYAAEFEAFLRECRTQSSANDAHAHANADSEADLDAEGQEPPLKKIKSKYAELESDSNVTRLLDKLADLSSYYLSYTMIDKYLSRSDINISKIANTDNKFVIKLFVYTLITEVLLDKINFGTLVSHESIPETPLQFEEKVSGFIGNLEETLALLQPYRKLKQAKLIGTENVKTEFDRAISKMIVNFEFIDFHVLALNQELKLLEQETNDYKTLPMQCFEKTNINRIQFLIGNNMPSFEHCLSYTGPFRLSGIKGICYCCFMFSCTRRDKCNHKSRVPTLIFLILIFFCNHESISVKETTLASIHCFDDWLMFLMRQSEVPNILNYHIWIISLYRGENTRKVLTGADV